MIAGSLHVWLRLGIFIVFLALGTLGHARPSGAVPTLQIFIENATYDAESESWFFGGNNFTLWVIGDVASFGTIYDVKITAAFPESVTGNITLTPTTASPSFLPFAAPDTSTPIAPVSLSDPSSALTANGQCGSNGTIGTIPCLGGGTPLPQHGEYGPGVQWVEWAIGDMSAMDSPIGDYSTTTPDPADPSTYPSTGQINAYDVSLSGFPEGTIVHVDAFNHIAGKGRGKIQYIKAPFSHDGSAGSVPEPSSLVLLAGGSLVLIHRIARRSRARHDR